MKLIKTLRFACCIICTFFLIGCSVLGTYNPATEKREFITISTQEEVSMGQDIHKKFEEKYTYSTDQKKIDRLNKIANSIALVSDRQDYQYKFFLIESDEVNAFTTPGGYIYFYTGLFDRLKTDDEIAFVLAHEIGHCAAKHTIKKFQAAMGYNLIGTILLNTIGEGSSIASMGADVVSNIVFSAYGRKDEYESDRLGIKYMFLAGYNLQGSIKALRVLQQGSKGGGAPLIIRSHPYLDDRIIAAEQEIINVLYKFGN